jgi:hypothetical protein
MDNRKIVSDLNIISDIAGRLSAGKQVSELERDMLLEKLSAMYEWAKYGVFYTDADSDEQPAVAADDHASANAQTDADSDSFISFDNEPAAVPEHEEPDYDSMLSTVIFGEPLREEPEVASDANADDDEPLILHGEDNEEPAVADPDVPQTHAKHNRKAIMALYEDDYSGADSAPDNAPVTAPPADTDMRDDEPAAEEESDAPEQHSAEPEESASPDDDTIVLGDILGSDIKTIADEYAGHVPEDVATKLNSSKIESLRGNIGINDKFLMIRDMFDGNVDEYERTINELERFEDLDSAILYIYENYSWNPNSDGAKLLEDLLTRKLQ